MASGIAISRVSNRDRVMSFVVSRPGASRAEIADALGISRSSTALTVAELIGSMRLEERGATPGGSGAGSGRPTSRLYPVLAPGVVLALDFGHKHVAAAVTDLEGSIIGRRRTDFNVDDDAIGAIDLAAELVSGILNEKNFSVADLSATVASIPGPIDSRSGIVRSPMILSGWVGLDPAEEISRKIGTEVSVYNDANLGAWGERMYGAGREYDDFVYVKASDGIGAGLVINGALVHGARGLSGEIGHTPTEADALCRCGNSGCIEVVASGAAVRAKLAYTHSGIAPGQSLMSLTDSVSERIFSEAGRALGKVLADVCNLLNPSALIVGGELGEVGEPFVGGVRESVDRIAQPATAASVRVIPSQLGRHAEIMGAIAMAVEIGREKAARGTTGLPRTESPANIGANNH